MRAWDWIYGCVPDQKWGGGVYVLYHEGKVVYVGRGGLMRSRIQAHRRRFAFDAVKVAPIENVFEQKRLERRLLYRLRPSRNRVIPTNLHAVWWRTACRG